MLPTFATSWINHHMGRAYHGVLMRVLTAVMCGSRREDSEGLPSEGVERSAGRRGHLGTDAGATQAAATQAPALGQDLSKIMPKQEARPLE